MFPNLTALSSTEFVRDFVLALPREGERHRCGLRAAAFFIDTLRTLLQSFASKLYLTVQSDHEKGQAHPRNRFPVFDVDLVDQEKSRRAATAPGVDCDVGNLILEGPRNGRLSKRA